MSTYWLVEPHNRSDTTLLEIVTIVIWRKGLEAIVDTSNVGGTRKGQQLACKPQQRILTGIHAAELTFLCGYKGITTSLGLSHLINNSPDVSPEKGSLF